MSGLPSLYRRGTDIFGCKKIHPKRISPNSISVNNLPPLPTVNDLLILGRDEIIHMKELERSLRLVTTKKSHKQSTSNGSSLSSHISLKKAHPPTAPSYLDEILYGSDEDDEENEGNQAATTSETILEDDIEDENDDNGNENNLNNESIDELLNELDILEDEEENSRDPNEQNNSETPEPSNPNVENENEDEEDEDNLDEDIEEDEGDDQSHFSFQNFELQIDNEPTTSETRPISELLSDFQLINTDIFSIPHIIQRNRNSNTRTNDEEMALQNSLMNQSETSIQIDDALSFVSSICRGNRETESSTSSTQTANTESSIGTSSSSLSGIFYSTDQSSSRNSSRSIHESTNQDEISSSNSRSSRLTVPDRTAQNISNSQTGDSNNGHIQSNSSSQRSPNNEQSRNRISNSHGLMSPSAGSLTNSDQAEAPIRHPQVHSPSASQTTSGRRRRPI